MYLTKHLVRYQEAGGEIWLNALTGAIDRLSGDEVRCVDRAMKRQGGANGEQLLAQLMSRGYLYADEAAETEAFDRLVDQKLLEDAGTRVTNLVVCPTYSCNLRCVYCFERLPHGNPSRKSMNLDTVSQALEAFRQIRDGAPERLYALGLFGGEPLLPVNLAVVSAVLSAAKADALPVTIVTNGINIPAFIDVLEQYSGNIQAIQITIDGPEDVHDRRRPAAGGRKTFSATAGVVDLLLKIGIKVFLRVNVDRTNIGRLPELTRIAETRGWVGHDAFSCSIAPVKDHLHSGSIPNVTPAGEMLSAVLDVYDSDKSTEELFGFQGLQMLYSVASLLKEGVPSMPRVYNCEANYGGFWVAGPDGLLYACPECIGQPEMAIGRFSPILEIWQEKRELWVNRNIGALTNCKDCAMSTLCGGGCTYASLVSDDSEPDCDHGLEEAIGTFLKRRILTSD